jgi:hypothetical protein
MSQHTIGLTAAEMRVYMNTWLDLVAKEHDTQRTEATELVGQVLQLGTDQGDADDVVGRLSECKDEWRQDYIRNLQCLISFRQQDLKCTNAKNKKQFEKVRACLDEIVVNQ